MDDPLAVRCLSRDNADVVTPNYNHSDARAAGIPTLFGPFSRERETTIRFAEMPAQVNAAPGACTVRMRMSVIWAGIGIDGKCGQQSCR
jgi:hypothetical protein